MARLKKSLRKTLTSILLPIGLLIGGCSANFGPIKTSARISREALSYLTGLNDNPSVMEFYKNYERNLETETKKENAKLENIRKMSIIHQLSDPYLSYSQRSLLIEEQKILEEFCGDITGDAFRDTIKEDVLRPFELEWGVELYDYFFKESDEKTKKDNKAEKIKSSVYNFLKAEKIEFGFRPSFDSRKAGGRVYAKAEKFRLLTDFQEGKLEIGTDKKEEFKLRARFTKTLNENWSTQINYKLGKITRDDLSISFIREHYGKKSEIKNSQFLSNMQTRASLGIFGGYNKYNKQYIGLEFMQKF